MSERATREELMGLPHKELRERYEAAFGQVPRTPNRKWIVDRILEAPPPRPAARAVAAIRQGRKARQAATPLAPVPATEPRQAPAEAAARSVATASSAIRASGGCVYEMDDAAFEARAPDAREEDKEVDAEGEDDIEEAGDGEGGEDDGDGEGGNETAEGEEDGNEDPAAPLPSDPASAPTQRPPRRAPPAPSPALPAAAPARHPRGRFRGMTIDELRALYVQKVGRETSSMDKHYLIWKVREAEKGRIPIGPVVPGQRREGGIAQPTKTLPLTLPPESIVALDDAWVRTGFRSRMSFLRTAIREALERRNERAAATLFPKEDPGAVAT